VDHVQSFELSSTGFGPKYAPFIQYSEKPNRIKKIPPVSFPFPVPNVEGVWKNLKMSHSMIDSSTV
jgi:hypothetical protein